METAALMKGHVHRLLPIPAAEDQGKSARFGRYGEPCVQSMVRKAHPLADEGSYFLCNNAQTAITAVAATAFAATTPLLIVTNTDVPTNPNAKSIYLDFLSLLNGSTAFSNSTSNIGMFWASYLDQLARYSSGGSNLSANIVSPNSGVANPTSVAKVYLGSLTAAAAGPNVRCLIGQRLFRAPVTATAMSLAYLDDWHYEFGSVESPPAGTPGTSGTVNANALHSVFKHPPVVIGPGHSFLLYLWMAANSGQTGGTLLPDLGWWRR